MKNFIAYVILPLALVTQAWAHGTKIKPEFVDTLLAPYFAIQMGLAKDNLKAAQTASASFNEVTANGPYSKKEPEIKIFLDTSKKLTEAQDIEQAREHFRDMSKEMIHLIDHVGTVKTTAYQMHCGMSFNNKGASWLQANDELINPYWGARMLRCGHEEMIHAPKK